ncbi:MAG: VOC family protein [Bacteroidota bacterium]
MTLGAFSVSLSVSDLAASRAFYETLGFEVADGDEAAHFLILRNGEQVIGLFHGMFEGNLLTFNPGWDQHAQPLESFTDVRDLQAEFKARGLPIVKETDNSTEGPASFVLMDPDGNVILVDQHV